MDRCGRGRGGGTPYGMPLRRIPPFMPTPTADAMCGLGATGSSTAGDHDKVTDDEREQQKQQQPSEDGVFCPTLDQVEQTKMILTAKDLPWEVINIIMDNAEYWASTTASMNYRELGMRGLAIYGGYEERENRFLLRSHPIGLTKWSPPAQDSPDFKAWTEAAKPKTVRSDGHASELLHSEGTKSTQEDPALPAPSSSPPSATKDTTTAAATAIAMSQEEVDFSKDALEKLTDIPVPTLENPVRKIVFDFVSADQGHGGWEDGMRLDAPYDGSNTWFDAGLDRFDKTIKCTESVGEQKEPEERPLNLHPGMIRPVWPRSEVPENKDQYGRRVNNEETGPPSYIHALHPDPQHAIQRNRRAEREMQRHHVEWTWLDDSITGEEDVGFLGHNPGGNGDFVRGLRLGDMVTIWGRARYAGWTNHVQRIDMRIYYAV